MRVGERTNERTSKVFWGSTIFIEISLGNKKYTLCDTSAFVNVSQNVEKLFFLFFLPFLFFVEKRGYTLHFIYFCCARFSLELSFLRLCHLAKDRTMVQVKCIMYKNRNVGCAVCQRDWEIKNSLCLLCFFSSFSLKFFRFLPKDIFHRYLLFSFLLWWCLLLIRLSISMINFNTIECLLIPYEASTVKENREWRHRKQSKKGNRSKRVRQGRIFYRVCQVFSTCYVLSRIVVSEVHVRPNLIYNQTFVRHREIYTILLFELIYFTENSILLYFDFYLGVHQIVI